jgi:CTP synthase
VESADERVSNVLDRIVKRIFKLFCSQERFFDTVNIVLVGKYTDFKDSYMSVIKALEHSAFRVHRKLNLQVCS